MNQSVPQMVLLVLDALWRRRVLLVVPILVIPVLGLAFAKFGPRPYVATSLLLLQENSRDNPLSREIQAIVNMQDRINGLIALLKSDRVLHAVMNDIAGEDMPSNPKEEAIFKKELAEALSLELMGNDFLQLQLKDTSPKGLGRKLEAVVSRFIEALLPAHDVRSAMQVLVDRRKEELEAAEGDYSRFEKEVGPGLEMTLRAEMAALDEQKSKLTQASEAQQKLSKAVAELRTQANVEALRSAEAKHAAMEKEVQELAAGVDRHQRKVHELRGFEQRLHALADKAADARKMHQASSRRYLTPSAAGSASSILNAPERIKLIDLPRDPVFPATSAKKIILGSIALSLLVAFGLVFMAEMLDTTVRRENSFEDLTGLPVIARLPGPQSDAAGHA